MHKLFINKQICQTTDWQRFGFQCNVRIFEMFSCTLVFQNREKLRAKGESDETGGGDGDGDEAGGRGQSRTLVKVSKGRSHTNIARALCSIYNYIYYSSGIIAMISIQLLILHSNRIRILHNSNLKRVLRNGRIGDLLLD